MTRASPLLTAAKPRQQALPKPVHRSRWQSPYTPFDAVVGGRSAAPAVVSMLYAQHTKNTANYRGHSCYNRPSVADKAFRVCALKQTLESGEEFMAANDAPIPKPISYQANGEAMPVGHLLKNPEYAAVLRLIAAELRV